MAHISFWKDMNHTLNDQTVYYHYNPLLKDNIEHDVHDILASNSNVTYCTQCRTHQTFRLTNQQL